MSKKKLKRAIKLLEKELLWYDEKLTETRTHFEQATGENYNLWWFKNTIGEAQAAKTGYWSDEPSEASGEVQVRPAWLVPPPTFEGKVVGFGLPARWADKPTHVEKENPSEEGLSTGQLTGL